MAKRHTDGYQCSLCHSGQIHTVRPKLPKIRG
jgi:aerobic-type carbon monoxide dehydrogenase small subunit (CoxS/CutS family)